jgi:tetratricopeptide (TPR) repeat protein
VFARLAVFQGGFTRETAAEVAGAALADLADLALAALVHHRPGDDRYTLHELLRAYAVERLAEEQADTAARDAHAAFFCAYVAQHAPELRAPRQYTARLALEREQENIAVAWRWAVDQRLVAQLNASAQPLGLFYELRADALRGAAAFDDAVARLGEDAGLAPLLRARLLTWRSAFLRSRGELAEAERTARRALELLDSAPERGEAWQATRAHACTRLAITVQAQRGGEAAPAYEAALAGYRAAGRPWEESFVLYHLARLSADLGRLTLAAQYAQASLELRAASGDARSLAHTLQLLSQIQIMMGALPQALARAEECHITFRGLGEEAGIAKGLHQRGVVLYWHGRFAEALALAEQSATIYDDLGLALEVGTSQTLMGLAYVALGQAEAAEATARAAIGLHQQPGLLADDYHALGLGLLARGRAVAAEEALRTSLMLYRQIGRVVAPQAAPYLALCLLQQNRLEPARALLAEALGVAGQQHAFQPALLALAAAVPLLAATGCAPAAAAAAGIARRFPAVSDNALLQSFLRRSDDAGPAPDPPDPARAPARADQIWPAVQEALSVLARAATPRSC